MTLDDPLAAVSEAAAGKTVARIETDVTNEYGRRCDDTVLIVFTDGSAVEVTGSSYEEVSQSVDEIDAAKVQQYQRAAQGRRESERLARLRREEFAALPAEVREERERVRRAKLSPFARVMEDMERQMSRALIADLNRTSYGDLPGDGKITFPVDRSQRKGKARRS